MTNQVENAEKSRRAAVMIEETEKIRKAFLESQIGKILEVLPEEFHGDFVQGYTANYTPVRILGATDGKDIIKAEIISVEDDFCIGKKI
ncbi:MAG: hypothetical protein J6R20_08510 [Clostridia bacterium]|nr:hypothetical protein [Clostridia bacterium]